MQSVETIIQLIPNFGAGGAQRVFSTLSNGLQPEYNIIEVVFNRDEQNLYSQKANIISLDVPAGSNLLQKIIYFILRCVRLNQLKRKYRPSRCISHLEGANFVNILSFGPGKKILTIHGSKSAFDTNRRGVVKFIENKILTPLLYRFSNKIITVSFGIKEELIKFFSIPDGLIQVIQNGVDVEDIRTKSKEIIEEILDPVFERRVIVFSGRLAVQKNPLSVIDIFCRTLSSEDFNLLIIGDGDLKERMLNKCAEHKIDYFDMSKHSAVHKSHRIFFLGQQSNPFKYIRRAHLFIMTSHFEGFPLSLCEALVCELPILATDCPTGVREVLAPATDFSKRVSEHAAEYVDHGVLMPVFSYDETTEKEENLWADTIIDILEYTDLNKKFRNKSKKRIQDFTLERFLDQWRLLLKEI